MEKRIGIIGLGGIACGKHIPQLQQSTGGYITAICDIDPKKLQEVGDRLGIASHLRFTDYHQLIDCPEVDAVEICTPNHLHVPMAVAAVEAGKPYNLEKPLSTDYRTAQELSKALQAHPIDNMMCFSYRFMPAVRYAKQLLSQGKLGDVVSVDVAYLKSSAFWEGRRLDWRFVKEYAGTGVLGDLGVHLIDMAEFLVGSIQEVSATTAIVVKKRQRLDSDEWADVDTDDYCSFLANISGGVKAVFSITRCALGHANTIKYDIFCTNGTLSFDLTRPELLMLHIGREDPNHQRLETVTVPPEFHTTQEQTFLDLLNGKPCPYLPTTEDGLRCQQILDAIERSDREKRWIRITECN